MKRVAITGMGLVDTLGNSPDSCYREYTEGSYNAPEPYKGKGEFNKERAGYYAQMDNLLKPDNVDDKFYKYLEKECKMGLHVIEQALGDRERSQNVPVVFSTITAGGDSNYDFLEVTSDKSTKRINPFTQLQMVRDFFVGYVPKVYNLTGPATSMHSACSTGMFNLDYACRMVDDYDYVICGASDVGTTRGETGFFGLVGALSPTNNSAPFCSERDGIVMGDGAACFILESEEKAKARNAKIYGYVVGIGMGNDGEKGSAVAPDPEMSGAKKAMTEAVRNHDINAITWVNAHGTGTSVGDELEYHAIQDVLGEIDVISFKSKLGHTMGASGLVESVYLLTAMSMGQIPQNWNIKKFPKGVDVPMNLQGDVGAFALKNSFAFGGKNVSVLYEGV